MPAYNKVGNVIFFHQYAESPEAIDTTVEKTSFPPSYAPLLRMIYYFHRILR
jgi:hypothetical protein